MSIKFEADELSGNCGIDVFSYFSDNAGWNKKDFNWHQKNPFAGSNLVIASFNESDICKKAYKEFTKGMTLLYQSPVYHNRLHKDKEGIFMCVFDRGDRDDSKYSMDNW